MLPVASLRPVQNRLAENWMTCWASFADGLRLLLQFVPCFLCCVQFVPLCQQPQLQAELPSELPTDFSISTSISWCSFFGFLRFNRPGFCSDLSHPSTHRPFCASAPQEIAFSTRQLSTPQLQSPSSISTWCSLGFLGNLQFLLCCNVLMTFSILVSRHRSNFFLRDVVLLVRFSLLWATLWTACCWLCS